MKTTEAARGKWKDIITSLGVDPAFLTGKHMKCPFCGGKDRFRFDDKDGSGSYFCSGCGAGAGIDFVMNARLWDFQKAAMEVDLLVGSAKHSAIKKDRTDEEKCAAMKMLLDSSGRVVKGTASWSYLESRCGDPGAIVSDLRNHPSLRHSAEGGSHPAMLAVLRYPDKKGASIHRTFLTKEGQKAPVDPVRKIMSGLPLAGASVRLGCVQDRLGIAEGIETAICAGKLHGLPVWSAISANGLISWLPPEGVRSVVIFGDNDASYTGQEAAFNLGKKLRLKHFDVEIVLPLETDTDFCDVYNNQEVK